MSANAVEGLDAIGAPLQHVTLITGAKYYGVQLGPSAAPAAETEPRHLGPNFYAQEDYLRSRDDDAWRWTHLIPTQLTGLALGNPTNPAPSVAVYASLVAFVLSRFRDKAIADDTARRRDAPRPRIVESSFPTAPAVCILEKRGRRPHA